MRKRLMLVLSILFAFSLVAAACGDSGSDDNAGSDSGPTSTEAPSSSEAPVSTEAPSSSEAPASTEAMAEPVKVGVVFDIGGRGDQSFNDSAAAGLDKAVAELGIEKSEAAASNDGSDREDLLNLQAEGNDLVFGIGFLFAEPITNAATAHPDTDFAIVDTTIEDAPPNIAMLVFSEQEGSFLVGVAAAMKTQTNKVGFIGGVNIPLIQRFQAGFEAGVKAVNPDIEIVAQYLTEPPDFSGFNDPAAGKVVGQSMYEGGADIVYHAAGGSGSGLFNAAKEYSEANGTKVWAIGVDSDQYNTAGTDVQDYILTSMLKRVDVAVFNTIKDEVEGNFTPGVHVFDLSVDGVGYSTSGGFVDDIVPQIEDFKAKIISGEIVVPETPS